MLSMPMDCTWGADLNDLANEAGGWRGSNWGSGGFRLCWICFTGPVSPQHALNRVAGALYGLIDCGGMLASPAGLLPSHQKFHMDRLLPASKALMNNTQQLFHEAAGAKK